MPRWQRPHTGPFAGFVLVCVLVVVADVIHGEGECGAATAAPWQPVELRHEKPTIPPVKSAAWQTWQVENPAGTVAFGKDFAAAPCTSGALQPGMWPGPFG